MTGAKLRLVVYLVGDLVVFNSRPQKERGLRGGEWVHKRLERAPGQNLIVCRRGLF